MIAPKQQGKASESSGVNTGSNIVFGVKEAASNLICIDPEYGAKNWEADINTAIERDLCAWGGYVFAAAMDGQIYAVDEYTGDIAWTLKTPSRVSSSLMVYDSYLIVPFESNGVSAFDISDGERNLEHPNRYAICLVLYRRKTHLCWD